MDISVAGRQFIRMGLTSQPFFVSDNTYSWAKALHQILMEIDLKQRKK